MLGDKRSNSIFAAHPVAAPVEARPEPAEVHDIAFEEDTGRSIFAEAKVAPKASEVFFAPQAEGMPFGEVLSQVQSYLSGAYATLITDSGDEAKEQMKRRIARYLQDNRMAVDGMTQGELVDALYTEMAEYGFLTKYIFADGIEEIDILKERYRQAVEYMEWFQPAWDQLSEDERYVLDAIYGEENEYGTNAIYSICDYFSIERSSAYNKKNRALSTW